jgi:hypothetical protein
MVNKTQQALEPLQHLLAADGYVLDLRSTSTDGEELLITVTAGPGVCEECLVPVDLFRTLVTRHLTENGLNPKVTIVYPD